MCGFIRTQHLLCFRYGISIKSGSVQPNDFPYIRYVKQRYKLAIKVKKFKMSMIEGHLSFKPIYMYTYVYMDHCRINENIRCTCMCMSANASVKRLHYKKNHKTNKSL